MRKGRGWLRSYAWSAPSLTLIALMVVFPILYTLYISLTNMSVYHWFDFSFIGLENYRRALLVFDSGFLSALLWTILWTIVNMAVQLVLAFALASLLNVKKLRLRKLYKTILMFPWAMPGYVSILLWKTGIFNSQFGLLNQWAEALGLEARRWLATDVSAFVFCTVVNLWLALPFMIMIMDGAMQSIDESYYESARLDGATRLQRAVYITIPTIRPMIAPAVIITVFTTFKQFDVVYLLTQQMGAQTGSNFPHRAYLRLRKRLHHQQLRLFLGYFHAHLRAASALFPPAAKGGDQVKRGKLRSIASVGALNLFFIALCFVTLIPILYALSVALSAQNTLLSSGFFLYPPRADAGQLPRRVRGRGRAALV